VYDKIVIENLKKYNGCITDGNQNNFYTNFVIKDGLEVGLKSFE